MKPIHLLVIGAVIAVGAVVYLTLDDSGSRHQTRTDVERDSERRGTQPGVDGTDGEKRGTKSARGLEATLKVVLPDGNPANGATVELVGPGRGTRTADAKGVARLTDLRAGYYSVIAKHGAAIGSLSFSIEESTDLGTLTLAESIWLRGTVYDSLGKPMSGATVEAVTSMQLAGYNLSAIVRRMTSPEEVAAHTVTDGDGVYALQVASGGSFAVRVNAPGFGQEAEAGRRYTASVEGLDFYLFPGTAVAGKVVTVDGAPIAGARVIFVDPMQMFTGRTPKAEAITGADGLFALSIMPSQQMMLVTRASGYAAKMDQIKPPANDLTIELEAGITVRLRTVELDKGTPAPGVTVALTYKGGFQVGETDENGLLIVENMPTSGPRGWGSQQQLFLWGGDYVAKMENIKDAKAEEGLLDLGEIEMTLGGIVRGTVTDGDTQEPVANAKVRSYGGLNMQLQFMETTSAVTGKDGKYELRGVPLGATMVAAQHTDYVNQLDPMQLVTGMRGGKSIFPEGQRDTTRDIVMTPAHSITGVVVGPDGSPVAGAKVAKVADGQMAFLQIVSGGAIEAFTDAEGKFRLGGLKPKESVRIVATHRSFGASEEIRTVAGAGDAITLELAEPIEIHGRVDNQNGDPVAGVRVTVARAKNDRAANPLQQMQGLDGGSTRPAVTTEKGEYILRNAPEGDLILTFDHSDYAILKQQIRTVAGAPVEALKATLDRGAGIEGVVVDEAGEPVAGVNLNANLGGQNIMNPRTSQQPGRTWATDSTDEDGRFELFGLREGQFTLRIYRPGFYCEPLTVQTGTKDVRLSIQPEGQLVGRVTANGRPVKGANVNAQKPGPAGTTGRAQSNFIAWAQTDEDGKFTLKPLPPNTTFKLVITHQGFKQNTIENVTASGERVRDFAIDPGIRIGGTVVDESGDPIPNASIVVTQEKTKWVRTNQKGEWEVGGLEAGEIKVMMAPGQFIRNDPIVVEPGDMNIRLVARPGESISGEVAMPEKGLQAKIDAIDADGKVANSTWIWGQNKSFVIRGLPKGTYTIKVSKFSQVATPGQTPTEEVLAEIKDVRTGTTDLAIDLR